MRRAWPTYETYRTLRVQRPIVRCGVRASNNYFTIKTTTIPFRVERHSALVRTFISAAKHPTQVRLRPNVPIPQRYISDEELHRRIRELKEDEARHARRKAFRSAIRDALAQSNTTIRAFQLATAQALITREDDIDDAQDQENSSLRATSDLTMASQVGDEEAFMAAVDTALEQSLAGPKGSSVRPIERPSISVSAITSSTEESTSDTRHAQLDEQEGPKTAADIRSEQDLAETKTPGMRPRKKPPVYVRATTPSSEERTYDSLRTVRKGGRSKVGSHAEDVIRRRNAHIRQLAGLPPTEVESEINIHSDEEVEVDDATVATYKVKDVYEMFSPKWNALLEHYIMLRDDSRQIGRMFSELQHFHYFHGNPEQALSWRATCYPYEQTNRAMERAAHLLRFQLRSRLVKDLFYGGAITLERWCEHILDRVHHLTGEAVEISRFYKSIESRISHPRVAGIRQKMLTMSGRLASFRVIFSEYRVGVYWLRYIQYLLRGDSPLALLEKEYFMKSNALTRYQRTANWLMKPSLYEFRRASEAAHQVLKMKYGDFSKWPKRARLYSHLRNAVHQKAARVDAVTRELSAQLNLTTLAMFTRTKLEFESGLLQERKSEINDSFSRFVAGVKKDLKAKKAQNYELARKRAESIFSSPLNDENLAKMQAAKMLFAR